MYWQDFVLNRCIFLITAALNTALTEDNTFFFTARVMNGLKEGWFSELSSLWPGVSLSLEVKEVLHSEKSEYQDILVLQT
jgi:hypothetical protein